MRQRRTATLSPSLPQTLRAYQPKLQDDIADAAFSDTVMVTISVTAVDEPPIFSAGATSVPFDEVTGIDGDLLTSATEGEISIALSADPYSGKRPGGWGRWLPWLPLGSGAPTVASSTSILVNGELTFKAAAAPNFEKPADADKDNVYEVTITATDGNANMATRDVKVTVMNTEELGEVTLSQPTPRVGLAITASYSDHRRRVGQRHLAVVEDRWSIILGPTTDDQCSRKMKITSNSTRAIELLVARHERLAND